MIWKGAALHCTCIRKRGVCKQTCVRILTACTIKLLSHGKSIQPQCDLEITKMPGQYLLAIYMHLTTTIFQTSAGFLSFVFMTAFMNLSTKVSICKYYDYDGHVFHRTDKIVYVITFASLIWKNIVRWKRRETDHKHATHGPRSGMR